MDNRDIMSILEGRRTIRRFDESRKIPDGAVNDIKRAAKLSSSAINRQPLRYIYVRDTETVNAVFDITAWGGAIPNGEGRPKVGQRPTMFVAVLSVKELKCPFTQFDEGIAASNMTLAAYAHGIGSCIIGSVKHDPLRKLLNIGDEYDISPDDFVSMGKSTPFAGVRVNGRCLATVYNGKVAYVSDKLNQSV